MPEENQNHFDFDESMQVGLLRRLCNVNFFEKHFDTISPGHFDGEVLQFIAEVLLTWQRKYHADLTKDILKEEIKMTLKSGRQVPIEARIYEMVDKIYASRVPEKYIEARYVEWMRHQMMGRAILEAAELHRQKRYAEARRRIDDAYFSTDGYELGHMFLGSSEERAKRRSADRLERIPTLIPQLDHMLRGGIDRKSLAIIMGKPKKGKSFCLVNIGKGAVIGGYKVSHYTLEAGMPEEKVADRYDASFSGIALDKLRDASDRLIAAIERAKKTYGESLIIKAYAPKSCTVDTIRSHQKRLTASGFNSDVIIVDYADILKASSHYEQRWIELTNIFEELGGLASENNAVVWAASTVHRTQVKKEIAHIEDAGGAFDKMFVADVIITLNQSDKDKRESKMKIFLAAARNVPDGVQIEIETDFDHAQFAKPEAFDDEDEFVKRKDLYG